MSQDAEKAYEFHLLTAERWDDLEALFGPRGACADRSRPIMRRRA